MIQRSEHYIAAYVPEGLRSASVRSCNAHTTSSEPHTHHIFALQVTRFERLDEIKAVLEMITCSLKTLPLQSVEKVAQTACSPLGWHSMPATANEICIRAPSGRQVTPSRKCTIIGALTLWSLRRSCPRYSGSQH